MKTKTPFFSSSLRLAPLARTLLPLLACASFGLAQAQTTRGNPQVVSGSATFGQQGNVFSITNAPNTIINWQNFNIAAGDITRFIQQSSSSAVLNRITGQDPSQILGALQSNGHVFLINPNGIMFGHDSRVDVNGLTASTLNLSNADFLAGKKNFTATPGANAVHNQGAITTPSGGQVFLIAPDVRNSGVITSPQGQVVLAAGHSVQLVDSGNPDLHVVVSAPSDQAVNLGQVIAAGGRVGIYGALVRQRGLINADSAQRDASGKIVLKASLDATLEQGSVTSATGAGVGGEVSVQGERVGMSGNASIDVSGENGGGTALVGGGFKGTNPLIRNSIQTMFGSRASIKADALGRGNGGTVVLWSDGLTRGRGTISAGGGRVSGNGGMVETSGKSLDVNGISVYAGARNGARGTWLLDPSDIYIVSAEGTGGLDSADSFDDSPTEESRIVASLLTDARTNVVLEAHNNIFVGAPIEMASGNSLTMRAGGYIDIDAPINTNGGDLTLDAGRSYGAGINFFSPVTTAGGNVSLSASSDIYFAGMYNEAQLGAAGTTVEPNNYLDAGAGSISATAPYISVDGTFGLYSSNAITLRADYLGLYGKVGSKGPTLPELNLQVLSPATTMIVSDPFNQEGPSYPFLNTAYSGNWDVRSLNLGDASMTGQIEFYNDWALGGISRLNITTQAKVYVLGTVRMGSGSTMTVNAGYVYGGESGLLGADTLYLDTRSGIYGSSGSLMTSVRYLQAKNMAENGRYPISIVNDIPLNLSSVLQNGSGNQGDIYVQATGGLTLNSKEFNGVLGAVVGTSGAGNVVLESFSPLTIGGTVRTENGSLRIS